MCLFFLHKHNFLFNSILRPFFNTFNMATASFHTSDTPAATYIVDENNINQAHTRLLSKFETAWKANLDLSQKWDKNYMNNLFELITVKLIQLKAQNIVVETTSDESVLVKSEIEGKRLYIELFLTDDLPLNYDAVINIYENKKHVFGTAGSLKNVFDKAKTHFNLLEINEILRKAF